MQNPDRSNAELIVRNNTLQISVLNPENVFATIEQMLQVDANLLTIATSSTGTLGSFLTYDPLCNCWIFDCERNRRPWKVCLSMPEIIRWRLVAQTSMIQNRFHYTPNDRLRFPLPCSDIREQAAVIQWSHENERILGLLSDVLLLYQPEELPPEQWKPTGDLVVTQPLIDELFCLFRKLGPYLQYEFRGAFVLPGCDKSFSFKTSYASDLFSAYCLAELGNQRLMKVALQRGIARLPSLTALHEGSVSSIHSLFLD